MITLFVADIDGCLTHPFETPDWTSLGHIRALVEASEQDPSIPPMTLCTGRPLPYAESVAQWLGIRRPFVFESAGLFRWEDHRILTGLPSLKDPSMVTEDDTTVLRLEEVYRSPLLEPVLHMKQWLTRTLLPKHAGAVLEFTKLMDAGVVCPNPETIRSIHAEILDYLKGSDLPVEVHATDISVNVLLSGNNKRMGLTLLSRELGIPVRQMAYIGDSSGDVPALNIVGMPFAPSNAADIVKAVPGVAVLDHPVTEAVLEAYQRVIDFNLAQLAVQS